TSPGRVVQVPLSARQLEHPDLVASVHAALTASSLRPDLLRLEVSEAALEPDDPTLSATLVRLAQLGVRLALGDVGTSSLSLLRPSQLPVELLKLPPAAAASPDLVRAVTALGSALDMHVCIERRPTLAEPANALRAA